MNSCVHGVPAWMSCLDCVSEAAERAAAENLPSIYKLSGTTQLPACLLAPKHDTCPDCENFKGEYVIEGPALEPKYLYFKAKGEAEMVVRALNQAYGIGHAYGRGAGR